MLQFRMESTKSYLQNIEPNQKLIFSVRQGFLTIKLFLQYALIIKHLRLKISTNMQCTSSKLRIHFSQVVRS